MWLLGPRPHNYNRMPRVGRAVRHTSKRSSLPNPSRRGFQSYCLNWACSSLRWLLGTHARLGGEKMNLDKTLETKTKDRPSAEQALYYFVWLCQEMKEQNRLHAVAHPLHIPTHTISGSRPVKGRIDAHTRDISVNETQPLCLSYWTQPWHRQQKPLRNELMSQLDFTGWEKKGRENGMLRRNIFSFRKFASLKQHC